MITVDIFNNQNKLLEKREYNQEYIDIIPYQGRPLRVYRGIADGQLVHFSVVQE
jgi:hypothetical protein